MRVAYVCNFSQLLWILILLHFARDSESIFFQSPNSVLMNLIETLSGLKGPKPIHHYHMHYYPVPVMLPKPVPPPLPPPKIEIDLHSGHHDGYGSYGWSNRDYGKIHHDMELAASPSHTESPWMASYPDAWAKSGTGKHNSWGWENNELGSLTPANRPVSAAGKGHQYELVVNIFKEVETPKQRPAPPRGG